ncbi:hypothetical protein DF947_08805 [Pedobacter paludis]|uniref:Uncharacterized protein n=1 Tax=Pedobacter paludis TaxID=2203212 RepID=A0A317F1G8_9SPHI|nr:hypothetical protein DF947_08805 [Pedobacter paludis]
MCFFNFLFNYFTAPPASLQIAHKTDCKSRTILFKNQGVRRKNLEWEDSSFELTVKQLRIFSKPKSYTRHAEHVSYPNSLKTRFWKAVTVILRLPLVPLMLQATMKNCWLSANIGFRWQMKFEILPAKQLIITKAKTIRKRQIYFFLHHVK